MTAFDRALKRVRDESGKAPDAMAHAAAWLSPPGGEDAAVPADLLDRFTSEPASPGEARLERGLDPESPLAAFREERSEAPRDVPVPAFPDAAPTPPDAAPAPRAPAVKGLFSGFNPRTKGMLVSGSKMDESTAEQYGRLAAVLHHAQIERTIKKVMVTSAMAGEGKTLTALNLALTLSESYGRRVALIDADLRCSRVHELLNVVRVTGLSEALEDARPIQTRMVEVSPRLSVLLAGCANLDPKGALTSPRMAQILAEAAATFDWVIVDTPPVVLLSDTNLLARMVDVAVVVVRAGRTAYDNVERAIQTLDKKRVLGVVLNDAKDSEALQYYYSSPATP